MIKARPDIYMTSLILMLLFWLMIAWGHFVDLKKPSFTKDIINSFFFKFPYVPSGKMFVFIWYYALEKWFKQARCLNIHKYFLLQKRLQNLKPWSSNDVHWYDSANSKSKFWICFFVINRKKTVFVIKICVGTPVNKLNSNK